MRKFDQKKLVIATHNEGKLVEISALLEPFGIQVIGAADFGISEPAETEDTFAGNARIKAHHAAKTSNLPALSDDSGIEVAALDNAPGVYTADWAETPSGRDFDLAMQKTWDLLEANHAAFPRTARFCCTLCIAWPDGHDEIFEGSVSGSLTWPQRGDKGFGYDPMFLPLGHDITFAEMDPDDKHRISHRADAFNKLVSGVFA